MDPVDVARLEEARQAIALAEIAREHRRVAGGVAGRTEPGSWLNNAVNLGMAGPVNRGELEPVIAWFEAERIEPRVELCPFADPTLVEALGSLRFTLRGFESVLFRALSRDELVRPVHQTPTEVIVRPLDTSRDDDVWSYARTVVGGFTPPGEEPPASHVEAAAKVARHPRAHHFEARIDGRCVGGGGMEINTVVSGEARGTIAGLFGLSVLPEHRRRGIQQALIAARLNHAARHGARVATIASRPGAPTERNVRRMGFQTAYTKAVLARSGPGLVPTPG